VPNCLTEDGSTDIGGLLMGTFWGQRCWMIDSSLPTHTAQRAHADKIPFCARLPCPLFHCFGHHGAGRRRLLEAGADARHIPFFCEVVGIVPWKQFLYLSSFPMQKDQGERTKLVAIAGISHKSIHDMKMLKSVSKNHNRMFSIPCQHCLS